MATANNTGYNYTRGSQARAVTLAGGPKVLEILLAMCLRPLMVVKN